MSNQCSAVSCPFCKNDNRCKVDSDSKCWCQSAKIPATLIALLAKDKQRITCICSACVNAYMYDPVAFKAKYHMC